MDYNTIHPLLRELQIDLITSEPNPIVDWFTELCKELYVLETNVYHSNGGEILYYLNDNKIYNKRVIFFRDDSKGIFWCDYDLYWNVIEIKFEINFNLIQAITKILIDNIMNLSIAIPSYPFDRNLANKTLNNNISKPQRVYLHYQPKINMAMRNK